MPEDKEPVDLNDPVALVNDRFDRAKQARRPYEKEWYLNAAFFQGDQWVTWNSTMHKLEVPKAPSWRVRYVGNKMWPYGRKTLARLTMNRPIPGVVPNSTDEGDIEAAELAEKVLEYFERALSLPAKRRKMALMLIIFGTAFRKIYWDPGAGDETVGVRMTANAKGELVPEVDKDGKEVDDLVPQGDVDVEVLSPFRMYPRPGVESDDPRMKGVRWIIQAQRRTVDEIEDMYGVRVPAETNEEESIFERKMRSLRGILENTPGNDEDDPSATVKECWEEPSAKHRRGWVTTVAGNTLLREEEPPEKFGMPFVKTDWLVPPGSFWGLSPVGMARELQKSYNRTRSQIMEHLNLMTKGKWLVPRGSGVAQTALTSEPAEIVEYNALGNGMLRPEQAALRPLPASVFKGAEDITHDMQDVLDWHEVSQAKPPPGVKSGVAIAYLQEQDNTSLAPVVGGMEESEELVGKRTLQVVQANYTEARTIKVVGQRKEYQYLSFKGSELRDNTDVRVETGSALPMMQAAKHQFLMDLYGMGVIRDRSGQPSPEKLLKLLEFGQAEEIYDEDELDIARQKAEIKEMLTGEFAEPREWDLHRVHIDVIEAFMKSDDFERQPFEIRALLVTHRDQHISLWAQQTGALMGPGQQGAPKGAARPGSPSAASGQKLQAGRVIGG